MHPVVDPHPAFIAPFILLLLAIALSPFLFKDWWGRHYQKVAAGLGLVTVLYYVLGLHAGHRVVETMLEYGSFICLIGSLFIVCGGIHIKVAGQSKPVINVIYLLIGSVLANLVGTTGASMLLLRPWVRMNRFRYAGFHTAFFIFVVSNTGGCLTPVGDPPLFLGFLKGVPFTWTLQHLWLPWAILTALLVTVFWVWDTINIRRVPADVRQEKTQHETFAFQGGLNVLWLAAVLGSVFLPAPWREAGMVAAAAGSWFTTNAQVHKANDFSFDPIKEVAWLFLGIFATMVPALDYLSVHSRELGISSPVALYYCAGGLSSVLDNAPTYLTFLASSVAQFTNPATGLPLDVNNPADIARYLVEGRLELIAISLGAVWFGAMTYIGNGPNFMVKAIVEQSGCKTPHFLEYIYRYSLPVLLPLLIAVGSFVFFVLK